MRPITLQQNTLKSYYLGSYQNHIRAGNLKLSWKQAIFLSPKSQGGYLVPPQSKKIGVNALSNLLLW